MIFQRLSTPVTKRFVERRILETDARHLFRIIQDVDAYCEFLPLCSQSKVKRVWENGRVFDATLTVGLPWGGDGVQEQYTSRVHVRPEQLIIETKSIESRLFDSLQSRWKLKKLNHDDKSPLCDVHFEVAMTVSDIATATILDKILEHVASRQVVAFDRRCSEITQTGEVLIPRNER